MGLRLTCHRNSGAPGFLQSRLNAYMLSNPWAPVQSRVCKEELNLENAGCMRSFRDYSPSVYVGRGSTSVGTGASSCLEMEISHAP